MHRQTPIAQLLYNYLYPRPTLNDPPSFSAHLARNLVPEVRIEVATFYGDLNSTEARYPGLNYCHPPHRMRLGRFKYHKRLFDAFDNLGLTYHEIQEFCCWEGTRWARERFEKDEGIKVMDTTGDEIGPYIDRREVRAAEELRRHSITRETSISVIVEEAVPRADQSSFQRRIVNQDMGDIESEPDAEMEEHEPPAEAAARQQHVAALEQRRDQFITQRIIAAWEQGQSLSPEIEQFLKEQSERGDLGSNPTLARVLRARRRAARAQGYSVPPESSPVVATHSSRAAA